MMKKRLLAFVLAVVMRFLVDTHGTVIQKY